MLRARRLVFIFVGACGALRGAALRGPWTGVPVPAPSMTEYACPAVPELPRELVFDGYYTDAHYSVKDPRAEAAYQAAVAVPEDFARGVTRAADEYRTMGNVAAGRCGVVLLAGAAGQRAFTDAELSARKSRQGFYVQTWLCAGLSLAYLKLEGTAVDDPQQHAAIAGWLSKLGDRVRSFHDKLMRANSGDSRNNHHSWAGLAAAAAGIASNRQDLFAWGIEAARDALRQITPEGTLPREMERAGMALHYHLFAACALVLTAELGAANGIDLYDEDGGALQKLVMRDVSGLNDPSFFAQQTGVAQVPQPLTSGATILWAVPFERRFPDPALQELLSTTPRKGYWMFGGLPMP